MQLLIRDLGNFLGGIKRLYNSCEALTFENIDGTFEIMLRPDPEVDELMTFEVLVIYDEDKDKFGTFIKLLRLELFENEDEEFFLGRISIRKDADTSSEDVVSAMHKLNAFYAVRICPCGRYFIRDISPICFFCHMTSADEDMQFIQCSICHEETQRITMRRQSCCKHFMHVHCVERWFNSDASGENPTCPMCRAPIKKYL